VFGIRSGSPKSGQDAQRVFAIDVLQIVAAEDFGHTLAETKQTMPTTSNHHFSSPDTAAYRLG
jgi:hypothetical protein